MFKEKLNIFFFILFELFLFDIQFILNNKIFEKNYTKFEWKKVKKNGNNEFKKEKNGKNWDFVEKIK